MSSKRLTDILDVTYLQQLQDGFAAATNVTCTIAAPEGDRITAPSNWHGVCALCHDTPPCSAACRAKTLELVEKSRVNGTPVISDCPHGCMTTAAVPIIVDGHFLASWIFGQLVIDAPSPEVLKKTAGDLDVQESVITQAVKELPRYSADVFNKLFSLAGTMTDAMVAMGKRNMEIAAQERELRRITEHLEKRDLVLTQYVQASPSAMYISDNDTGEILIANQALCNLIDREMDDVVGKPCREVLSASIDGFCDLCPHQRRRSNNRMPKGPVTREFFHQEQGTWLRVVHHVVSWGARSGAQMVIIEDITREQSMRGQLEKLAYFDNFTGLPNSNRMAMDFRTELKTHGIPGSHMICLDLSPIRFFEDAYGKDNGDVMLKTVVSWIGREVVGNSQIYRLNTYEFCMLPDRDSSVDAVKALARRIRSRFEKPWQFTVDGREMSYVCQIYVSLIAIPHHIRRFQDLQGLISRTLNSGRQTSSGIYFYDEKKDRENQEHIQQVLSLKACFLQGMEGFSLNYQPIVKLSTGLWAGVEALCRWTRPGHGPVSPLVFIKEAEGLGMITELGTWILDTAVRQAKETGLDKVDDFFLSVNISPIQMMDPYFADGIAGILEKYQYPGGKLNLEITESAQMTFNSFTMDMIARLRALGVKLALDDFGTGYSSFSNLKHLPVDFLKTEREFITGIETDDYMKYFLYVISEIAHASNMKFIAEGIETAEQVRIARNNGADYIQGYFFSKPLSAEALRAQYERFLVPDKSYVPALADTINIQHWLSGKSAYELKPALFNLMNRCMLIMLKEKDAASALDSMIAYVGEHYGVSRAFAFVQEDDPEYYSNQFEWRNVNVSSHKEVFKHVMLQVTPSLINAFRENGMVIAGSMSELSPDMRNVLRGQNVEALLLLPMWDDDELIGFVGFDSTAERAWSAEETFTLWNLAILMANTIRGEKLKQQVVGNKGILATVLERSGMNAYVVDRETYELLWVNDSMFKMLSLPPDIVGKKCHEVLEGRPTPCSFCNMHELLETPEGVLIEHTVHSNHRGGDYLVFGSSARWGGRNNAVIRYIMDVTAQKKTEQQLQYLNSIDLLTGTLNRVTARTKMDELARAALKRGTPLALCYVDVDGLKRINERHGNDAGDQVLRHTAEAIRGMIRENGVIGRFQSDDFIVIMPDCEKSTALSRMAQAKKVLENAHALPDGTPVSFSFGASDLTELGNGEAPDQLLKLARDRMLAQKANHTGAGAAVAKNGAARRMKGRHMKLKDATVKDVRPTGNPHNPGG